MRSKASCLTQNFSLILRCIRCDLSLEKVTWKDQLLALSLSTRKKRGIKFLCVKCILSSKIAHSKQFTPEQLDKFLKKNHV